MNRNMTALKSSSLPANPMLLDLPRLSLLPECDLIREANILLQRVRHIPLCIIGRWRWRRQHVPGGHCLGILKYPLTPPFQLLVCVGRETAVTCACKMLASFIPTIRVYVRVDAISVSEAMMW